jgi:hypothetical protein
MTRRSKSLPTTTLQCWPDGRSYEYRGDLHGPASQRSLRDGRYQPRLRCPAPCFRVHRDNADGYGVSPSERAVDEIRKDGRVWADPRMGAYCVTTGGLSDGAVVLCPSCKGAGYVDNPKRNPWRKGTAAEWRAIRINVLANMYADRDVLCCDSSLITDLLALGSEERGDLARAFSVDSIENEYADPSDWDAETCRDYIREHSTDALPEAPVCPTCDGEKPDGETCGTCAGTNIDPDADDDETYLDALRDQARDIAQDNPSEVYEWWRVSSWLCDQLRAIGEVVIDNDYGEWWGRCTTGQGFIMDGVLQRVAAQFEKEGE